MRYWVALPKRMRWTGLTTLVAALWFFPAPVQASCGDYVMVPSSHSEQGSSEAPSTQPGDTTPPHRPDGKPSAPRPACQGRNCAVPPAPATTLPSAGESDQLNILGMPANPSAPAPAVEMLCHRDSAAQAGYPSSIYHPPRV